MRETFRSFQTPGLKSCFQPLALRAVQQGAPVVANLIFSLIPRGARCVMMIMITTSALAACQALWLNASTYVEYVLDRSAGMCGSSRPTARWVLDGSRMTTLSGWLVGWSVNETAPTPPLFQVLRLTFSPAQENPPRRRARCPDPTRPDPTRNQPVCRSYSFIAPPARCRLPPPPCSWGSRSLATASPVPPAPCPPRVPVSQSGAPLCRQAPPRPTSPPQVSLVLGLASACFKLATPVSCLVSSLISTECDDDDDVDDECGMCVVWHVSLFSLRFYLLLFY